MNPVTTKPRMRRRLVIAAGAAALSAAGAGGFLLHSGGGVANVHLTSVTSGKTAADVPETNNGPADAPEVGAAAETPDAPGAPDVQSGPQSGAQADGNFDGNVEQ